MKRYGRGADLLQRALQLSDINSNDNMMHDSYPDESGSQITRKGMKRKIKDATGTNYKQNIKHDQPGSNVNSNENSVEIVGVHNRILSTTTGEFAICENRILDEITGDFIKPKTVTASSLPQSSPPPLSLISSSIFLDESTGEVRGHDIVLPDIINTPTNTLSTAETVLEDVELNPNIDDCALLAETAQLEADLNDQDENMVKDFVQEIATLFQKSPCVSPSLLNPTSISGFQDEKKDHSETPCLHLGDKIALSASTTYTATVESNLKSDKATNEFGLHDDIVNASCLNSSPSISNFIFLDEKTGEVRSQDLVLSDTTNDTEIVQQGLDFNCSDDDQDVNYEPDQDETTDYSTDSESENRPLGKKRRGIKRQPQWDRNQQKLRRMKGKNYNGLKKHEGKWTQSNSRPARKMKNACDCKSAKFECRKLTEDARREIYNNFWQNLNWEQRKVYIAGLVTKVPPTSRRQNIEISRRNNTLNYHLRFNETRFRVCKQMFLNTFDLGEKSVRMWCMRNQSGIPISTSPRPSQTHTERDNHLQLFLNLLPKMESHYCRANSTKIYLEPNWTSLKELHSFYQKKATEDNIKPYAWTHFIQELNKQNITLFQNRKDQCDTCFAFTETRVDQSVYDLHILRKTMGRNEKSSDKRLAEMDNTMKVFCVDVQAVLLAPKLNVSLAYYKIKLKLHNFTSYDLVTRKGRCYLWDEVNGGLEAEVFASLYVDLIKTEFERSTTHLTKIVLWSDGCCYQNRNQVVANAILDCAVKLGIVIEQKYLEHGHTFMEVDSEHSVIERKIQKKDIYIPAEYVGIIESARTNPSPYEVHSLKYSFFKDYSKIQYYSSIRPGNRAGDNVVNDIRSLKYNPNGTIEYKIMYDDDWTLLPRRTRLPNTNIEPPALYNSKININLRKFQDLQDLKNLLHENYHSYYDSLPHDCQNQASCPHVKRT